jgi:hypothetical protein
MPQVTFLSVIYIGRSPVGRYVKSGGEAEQHGPQVSERIGIVCRPSMRLHLAEERQRDAGIDKPPLRILKVLREPADQRRGLVERIPVGSLFHRFGCSTSGQP